MKECESWISIVYVKGYDYKDSLVKDGSWTTYKDVPTISQLLVLQRKCASW